MELNLLENGLELAAKSASKYQSSGRYARNMQVSQLQCTGRNFKLCRTSNSQNTGFLKEQNETWNETTHSNFTSDVVRYPNKLFKRKHESKNLHEFLRLRQKESSMEHRQDPAIVKKLRMSKTVENLHRVTDNCHIESQSSDLLSTIKYLPFIDILNYKGQTVTNPKLIKRRVMNKVTKKHACY